MTLVVGKNAVALHMGAPPYRRKLEQAIRVIAELDRRGAKPDSIMLDNEARPDRVVVRNALNRQHPPGTVVSRFAFKCWESLVAGMKERLRPCIGWSDMDIHVI